MPVGEFDAALPVLGVAKRHRARVGRDGEHVVDGGVLVELPGDVPVNDVVQRVLDPDDADNLVEHDGLPRSVVMAKA